MRFDFNRQTSNWRLLENLLLKNKEDLGSVKLADFGLAAQYDLKTNMIMSFSEKWGTRIYMAPEMFGKNEYGKVSIRYNFD